MQTGGVALRYLFVTLLQGAPDRDLADMDWIASPVSPEHDLFGSMFAHNRYGLSFVNLLVVQFNVDLVPVPAVF